MDISFENKILKKCADDIAFANKKLGANQDRKYQIRIEMLANANNLEELRYMAGKFHELISTRRGQWACHLIEPYRLVFKPQHDPIPTNENGQYIWEEITAVHIIEIIDYH